MAAEVRGLSPSPTGAGQGAAVPHVATAISRVRRECRSSRTTLGSGKLFYPQGFGTDTKGDIYVSNWSIFNGGPSLAHTGEVVRIAQ
jgi:hypothetical protein